MGMTAVLLVAAFVAGFIVELSSVVDRFWVFIVGVVVPWLFILTATLVYIARGNVRLIPALAGGLVLGYLTATLFAAGLVSPNVMELGNRDIEDIGGEAPLLEALALGLIMAALAGAIVGPASGMAAWALRVGLAKSGLIVSGLERRSQ